MLRTMNPNNLPLEDLYEDIVGKACRGTDHPLPNPLPTEKSAVEELARVLQLDATALWESACGGCLPENPEPIEGLSVFTTEYGDMTVNSFLIFDPASQEAAAFDTGSDASGMLAAHLPIGKIFLTHIHGDHIFDLDRLREKTGAQAFVSAREPLDGATAFADGTTFSIGSLRVTTSRTSGHARGGTTYVVQGLARPLAVVGDALFSGSMGGTQTPGAYAEALRTGALAIFSLPDETVLCPGHGPLTTVAHEKLHNPFFASAFRH